MLWKKGITFAFLFAATLSLLPLAMLSCTLGQEEVIATPSSSAGAPETR